MKLRFERDEPQLLIVGSVEGRPEAVRVFLDIDLRHCYSECNSPMTEWINELVDYLGEPVESITRV